MTDRLEQLDTLIAVLRGPGGCPWDREQTIADLRAYLLEEAHETAAAIDARDYAALEAELGDLLFQIVFIASLARESAGFDLTSIVSRVRDKMIERHPHVFGDEDLPDSDSVRQAWEKRKARARSGSVLDGLPDSLPALLMAYRMSQKAAGVGFDWVDMASIFSKIEEELTELRKALSSEEEGTPAIREELGDLLFTMANLGRRLGIDPESALAEANLKFRRRFQSVERKLNERGGDVSSTSLAQLDHLWNEVKKEEE